MPFHCRWCVESPRLRSLDHCLDCGYEVPVDDLGLCDPCASWLRGERRLFDDADTQETILAAVVERAVSDARSALLGRKDTAVPPFCDECGRHTYECASEYVQTVRQFGHAVEGDAVAILGLVARVALDRAA